MEITVAIIKIHQPEPSDKPFRVKDIFEDLGIEIGRGILTDEHPASSYGQPILLIEGDGQGRIREIADGIYGPGDLPKDYELEGSLMGENHPLVRAWDRLRKLIRVRGA